MTSKIVTDTAKKPPNAGKGRPKGAVNKVTALAKDTIAKAAAELGGADRLVAWAKEDPANERAFWATIYPKLIPVQVNHADAEGGALTVQLVRFADDQAS